MGPHLPPEIIDRIIDHLHDNQADLRTCARVCRAWLTSSRFHLFYSISINSGPWRRMYRAVQRSPDIALHVRELRLFPDMPEPRDIVPDLLRSFAALRKLEVREFSWTLLTPEVRESIRGILALPSLVHFNVDSADFCRIEHFANLIHPHLKRLDVCHQSRIFLEDGNDDMITQARLQVDREVEQDMVEREPCCLEHLMVLPSILSFRFIDWLLGSQTIIDISNLHTFECTVEGTYFQDNVVKLLRRSRSSIEVLSLCVPHLSPTVLCTDVAFAGSKIDVANVIDFGCLPKLRVLSLEVLWDPDTAKYLTSTLFNVTVPNLQHISFEIYFLRDTSFEDTTWTDWMEVDYVLNNEKFGSLRSVKILGGRISLIRDLIRQKFIDHFPLLASRGLLEVKIYGSC
jgi:hypothetical protein